MWHTSVTLISRSRLGITCSKFWIVWKVLYVVGRNVQESRIQREDVCVWPQNTVVLNLLWENGVACLYILILDFECDFRNYNSHSAHIILSKRYDAGSFWPYAARSYCISFIFNVVDIVSRNLGFRKPPARRAVLDELDNTFTHNNWICIF